MTLQIFNDITEHLLNDERPSKYLNKLLIEGRLTEYPLNMLMELEKTEQSPKYHAEGNVWIHTMMVVDEAAAVKEKSRNPAVFMWAALLHDIGKPETTSMNNGRITAYNHDIAGARLAEDFLRYYNCTEDFIENVTALVRWHMQILYIVRGRPNANLEKMKEEADLEEIALLGYCDRMGRLGIDRELEQENIRLFLQKARSLEGEEESYA